MWHFVLFQEQHTDNKCLGGLHRHPIKYPTPLFDNPPPDQRFDFGNIFAEGKKAFKHCA
jgi:hypothetical protein